MDGLSIKAIILQIIGFLILLWGLRKFAWGPLMGMMDQRTKDVQDVYDKANEALKAAEVARVQYEEHLGRIEQEAHDRLAAEVKRGQEIADKLILDAREESAREQEEARNAIAEELRRAKLDLRDFIAETTVEVAGRVLQQHLSKDDHLKVVESYIDQLLEKTN